KCSRRSAATGSHLWRQSIASPGPNMPDWKAEIRQRLAKLTLEPTRETEIVEELAQHLDDRYQELRAGGAMEAEASRAALAELSESRWLAHGLGRVEPQVAAEPVGWGA